MEYGLNMGIENRCRIWALIGIIVQLSSLAICSYQNEWLKNNELHFYKFNIVKVIERQWFVVKDEFLIPQQITEFE